MNPQAIRVSRWTLPLRAWQKEACDVWWRTAPQDALIVACPGAGKTRFAMRLAHALLEAGKISRVLVVVPKDHLKGQVSRSMAGAGIVLEPRFENSAGVLPSDLHGAVISYQQVAFAPLVFRRLVREQPTLVILDEIHHAGDEATWGKALRDAFDGATHRVSMSGTPFRSDGTPIPFVSYDRGLCTADYSYEYGQALKDGVCRPLVFPLHGVVAEWVSRDGVAIEASFDTALENRRQESERLRTALTQEGWMGTVIARANEQLHAIREEGHRDAAGLIVCMNQEHARYVAKLVHRIAGVDPVIVVSEDDEAAKKIQRFAQSKQPWIVAVHMISEGVDIPRLRIGVYATNVGTPMYFRQFCGRFVRSQRDVPGNQHAFVFMPDDPYLRPLAASIHLEVQGHLKGKAERTGGPVLPTDAVASVQTDDFFSPIAAHATDGGVIHGNLSLFGDPEARADAARVLSPFAQDAVLDEGAPPENEMTAHSTRDRRRRTPGASVMPTVLSDSAAGGQGANPGDLLAEKRALRRDINALVSRVRDQFAVDHKKIHGSLNSRFGGSLASATKSDLERRRSELLRWITKNTYDGFR